MKILAFIMSCYMLALGCFPCGDSNECNETRQQKISTASQHQAHEHQDEACTPFCSCACCAAAAFHQPVAPCKNIAVAFHQLKFHYNDNFHSYDFHSVWPPPKLS